MLTDLFLLYFLHLFVCACVDAYVCVRVYTYVCVHMCVCPWVCVCECLENNFSASCFSFCHDCPRDKTGRQAW